MITLREKQFILNTADTTYAIGVTETGHLEHHYYGSKITVSDGETLKKRPSYMPGNTIAYDRQHPDFTLENVSLEMSSYGKGDVREPFVELIHADGARTCDFLFVSASVNKGKDPFQTLPGSYDESGQVDHLNILLEDAYYKLRLELHYYVYEEENVICRSARLCNDSEEQIQILRLLSTQLDLPGSGYIFSNFTGAWTREMNRHDTKVTAGKVVNASVAGCSSNRANPFVMLSREDTSEEHGSCYGINLIYSGNHYEALEVSGFEQTRFVAGLNPHGFSYRLDAGESFEAPEAVMTYSGEGYNGMSQNMHSFIRKHIVRGYWRDKERPVILNSWEAAYFDINEKKLLSLAKAAKEAGVELFVMDDGWFGNRDDDTRGLGDWEVNRRKLPKGISGLSKKIREMGMDFGLWVEPEMVNVDSSLYRSHPDWTMEIPGKAHSEGRNQRVLDLANPRVQQFVIDNMSEIFSLGEISYVKWDMNRIFSDIFSPYLPPERQGEVAHRYMLGLYHVLQELVTRFPEILFEGCASGGNRFDLGMLCYFPQIWGSDNTDAISRAVIQNGYSYGYPLSTVGAHVSACPNHQTMRVTPLSTRFAVACFGVCGYECNLCEMSKEELTQIREQIKFYKKWRSILQFGAFYRGRADNVFQWACVSQDRKQAIGMHLQQMMVPNQPDICYQARGLNPEKNYIFEIVEGEEPEKIMISGNALMEHGVNIKQAFTVSEGNEPISYFPDFAARLFYIEQEK